MEAFMLSFLEEAKSIALSQFKQAKVTHQKAHALDVVTETDTTIDNLFFERLKEHFPEHGIISEENGHYQTEAEYVWILDPIDGTLNFSRGIPLFGIMVALRKGKEMILSGISLPVLDELYIAKKGEGATCNGKPLQCSQNENWKESLVIMPTVMNPGKELIPKIVQTAIQDGSFFKMSLACAAIDAAFVASGKADAAIKLGGQIWDLAPGALLLEEAGCKVTKLDGSPFDPSERELLAANPVMHAKLVELIQEAKGGVISN